MSKTQKMLAVALIELKSGRTESAANLFASVSSAVDFDSVVSALAGREVNTSISSMQSDPLSEHKFSYLLGDADTEETEVNSSVNSPIRF